MSDKSLEKSEMADAVQAAELIREVVRVDAGATVKARIVVTARKLGWPYSRTRDVWYEQARRIDACEMDALRQAKHEREIKEAQSDFTELRSRIARLEAAVALANPTLDSEALAELERQMRGPGGMDRS